MQILDGKKVSEEIYSHLQGKVAALKEKNIYPRLALILIGENPASLSYVKQKRKVSEQIGIQTDFYHFDSSGVTTEKLLQEIQKLNKDQKIHGILVQLPLPKAVDTATVIKSIHPEKDVDGFTARNLGNMFLGVEFEQLTPCTPMGVIRLLEAYNISVIGRQIVMVGASNIVGKPLAVMLLNRKATVTVCNSKTPDITFHTTRADIVIVAVGKPKFITKNMVKKNAIVVDVGINRDEKGKIVGDVDFENVAPETSYITPVPGGCGPMTVACLMENVIKAAENLSLSLAHPVGEDTIC